MMNSYVVNFCSRVTSLREIRNGVGGAAPCDGIARAARHAEPASGRSPARPARPPRASLCHTHYSRFRDDLEIRAEKRQHGVFRPSSHGPTASVTYNFVPLRFERFRNLSDLDTR